MNATNLTELSQDQLIAIIQQLAARPVARLTLKVSAKGALSVYGFGQWPVTLYKTQWQRLLNADTVAEILQFLKDHDSVLTSKPVKE